MDELRGIWRGKRIDEKKWWADGYLICPEAAGKVAYIGYLAATDNHGIIIAPVDPSTLGECTGLRDRNGNPIFEGDIIRGKSKRLFRVEYNAKICGYVTRALDGESSAPCMNAGTMSSYAVVGNVHENPELLKGEANENI